MKDFKSTSYGCPIAAEICLMSCVTKGSKVLWLFEASTDFTSTPRGSAFSVPAARPYSPTSTTGSFGSSLPRILFKSCPAALLVKKSAKKLLMIAAVSSALVYLDTCFNVSSTGARYGTPLYCSARISWQICRIFGMPERAPKASTRLHEVGAKSVGSYGTLLLIQ